MFFCAATKKSCETLQNIILQYERASGQMINKTKSAITFSSKTPILMRNEAKAVLGISREGGEGKYLGLPENFARRKKDIFTSIVDRIRQRAAGWSTRFLSKAGKLTMLKSVLTAIPTYTMTCFMIPVSLCKRIQSALTRFWWDGTDDKRKMSWVSWPNLSKPKSDGVSALETYRLSTKLYLRN